MKKGFGLLSVITGIILITGCNNNDKPTTTKSNEAVENTIPLAEKKTIVFFGNSLTAGYGLSPDEAFPALIQKKIDYDPQGKFRSTWFSQMCLAFESDCIQSDNQHRSL